MQSDSHRDRGAKTDRLYLHKMSVINECFKDDTMRKLIVSQIGRVVWKEIRVPCSDEFGSILKKGNV